MKNKLEKENCTLDINDVFKKETIFDTSLLKKYILAYQLKEYKCEICELSNWNNQPIMLECHHVDGNRFNNELSNLQFLCSNCHAQTENFRGKNINGKREDYIDNETFINALKNNTSIRRTLIYLGLAPKGGNYDRAKKLIEENNIIINKRIIFRKSTKEKQYDNKVCKLCEKELKQSSSGFCRSCYNNTKVNHNKPSKEILEQEIKEYSFIELGKKYGVSDSSIRKWCKNYGIDYKCGVRKESLRGLKKGRETQSYRSKLKRICPRCGKQKNETSEICRTCYLELSLKEKQELFSK